MVLRAPEHSACAIIDCMNQATFNTPDAGLLCHHHYIDHIGRTFDYPSMDIEANDAVALRERLIEMISSRYSVSGAKAAVDMASTFEDYILNGKQEKNG